MPNNTHSPPKKIKKINTHTPSMWIFSSTSTTWQIQRTESKELYSEKLNLTHQVRKCWKRLEAARGQKLQKDTKHRAPHYTIIRKLVSEFLFLTILSFTFLHRELIWQQSQRLAITGEWDWIMSSNFGHTSLPSFFLFVERLSSPSQRRFQYHFRYHCTHQSPWSLSFSLPTSLWDWRCEKREKKREREREFRRISSHGRRMLPWNQKHVEFHGRHT